jgi:hypothetical protein
LQKPTAVITLTESLLPRTAIEDVAVYLEGEAMAEDADLLTFEVKFYADGQLCTAVVEGHDDYPTPHDADAMHYNVWRRMWDGQFATAFRCRYSDWVATYAPRDVPPTREEIEERDAIRDRAHVAEFRATEAEQRAANAEQRAAELVQEVEKLGAEVQAQARPMPITSTDEAPF